MPDSNPQEINEPDTPEIEQQSLPEFEQSTEHPQRDDMRVQSQGIRYKNADRVYK